MQGKDHWPENSWILAGRGVRGGVTIGATDEQLRSVPVDFDSGRPGGDAARPLTIDAVFGTILHLAGADPRAHGYGRDAVMRAALV